MFLLRFRFFVCLALALLWPVQGASAHPMGNFSINHYARFTAEADELKLRYVLDFAEIPTVDQMNKLDSNGDKKVSEAEKSAYLRANVPQFLKGLSLKIEGYEADLIASRATLETRPGAGDLLTLLVYIDVAVPLEVGGRARVGLRRYQLRGAHGLEGDHCDRR